MSNQVKISTIIPVYNAEKYLHQCVDSVIHQTLKDIEIICVDDGSTDASLEILHEYEKQDERVKILTQKNQFAGAARNAGMKIAQGEYIHFLDSDDYLEHNAYEILYNKAVEFDAEIVKAKTYQVNEATGKIIDVHWNNFSKFTDNDFNRIMSFEDEYEKFLRVHVVPWNGIYSKAFLEKWKIEYNSLLCVNDRSFWNAVAIRTRRAVFIQDYIVYHRINMSDSLVGRRAQNFDCQFQSYRIIEKQTAHLDDKIRAEIFNAELRDMFSWYRKFSKGPYGERIKEQMIAFLDTVDIGLILKHCEEIIWLNTWAEVLGKRISGLLTGSAREEVEKLRKIIWKVKNLGIYKFVRGIMRIPKKIRACIEKRNQEQE